MTPSRRSGTGITLDPDHVRMATGAGAADKADTTKATGSATRTPRRGTKGAATTKAAPEPEINEANPDAREGEAYPGEPTIKVGTAIPETLKHQMDGLVRYAQDTGDIPEVLSLVDVYRIALHRYVRQAQLDYNNGQEFKVPRFNRRGRPAR